MFQRKGSEESEWSRFSKAFTGKEKEAKLEANGEEPPKPEAIVNESDLAETTSDLPSPTSRPMPLDSNLTVSRPSMGSGGVHPTYSTDDVESTVGEHTFFDGTYRCEHSLRIRGTAQGEIESSQAVFIEESAKVSAKVTAASITVAGEVNGELNCAGRVEIRPSGRVTGTISAGSLIMQEGAYFDGNLKMMQPAREASFAT